MKFLFLALGAAGSPRKRSTLLILGLNPIEPPVRRDERGTRRDLEVVDDPETSVVISSGMDAGEGRTRRTAP